MYVVVVVNVLCMLSKHYRAHLHR